MTDRTAGKVKSRAGFLLAVSCIAVVCSTAGCVMAARKGAQKAEKRDGPVGHVLNEVKEDIHPGSQPTPAEE